MKKPFILKPLDKFNPNGVYGVSPQPTNTLLFATELVEGTQVVTQMKVTDGITMFKDLKNLLSAEQSVGLIPITFAELNTAVANSTLIPEQSYLLTDYQTTNNVTTGVLQTGPIEPLVLQASSVNAIYAEVKSTLHPEDDITYRITSSTTILKGLITRRVDTILGNDMPFDFRYAKFRRWKLKPAVWDNATLYPTKSIVSYGDGIWMCMAQHTNQTPVEGGRWWMNVIRDNTVRLSHSATAYTLTHVDGNIIIPADSADFEDYPMFTTYGPNVFGNKVLCNPGMINMVVHTNGSAFNFCRNTFHQFPSQVTFNSKGNYYCYDNTFGYVANCIFVGVNNGAGNTALANQYNSFPPYMVNVIYNTIFSTHNQLGGRISNSFIGSRNFSHVSSNLIRNSFLGGNIRNLTAPMGYVAMVADAGLFGTKFSGPLGYKSYGADAGGDQYPKFSIYKVLANKSIFGNAFSDLDTPTLMTDIDTKDILYYGIEEPDINGKANIDGGNYFTGDQDITEGDLKVTGRTDSSDGTDISTRIRGNELFIKAAGEGTEDTNEARIVLPLPSPTDEVSYYFPQAGEGQTQVFLATREDAGVLPVTYAQLVSRISNFELKTGQSYLITDYQTILTIPSAGGAVRTGPIEPIIVTAISSNTIASEARSTLHPEDIIYYTTANTSGSTKGYIFRRYDTFRGNDLSYDFRYMVFRRWKLNPPAWVGGTNYTYGATVLISNVIYVCIQAHSTSQDPATATDYWMIAIRDNTHHLSSTSTARTFMSNNVGLGLLVSIPVNASDFVDVPTFTNYTNVYGTKMAPDNTGFALANLVVFNDGQQFSFVRNTFGKNGSAGNTFSLRGTQYCYDNDFGQMSNSIVVAYNPGAANINNNAIVNNKFNLLGTAIISSNRFSNSVVSITNNIISSLVVNRLIVADALSYGLIGGSLNDVSFHRGGNIVLPNNYALEAVSFFGNVGVLRSSTGTQIYSRFSINASLTRKAFFGNVFSDALTPTAITEALTKDNIYIGIESGGGEVTGSNGINVVDSDIRLGGFLTEETTAIEDSDGNLILEIEQETGGDKQVTLQAEHVDDNRAYVEVRAQDNYSRVSLQANTSEGEVLNLILDTSIISQAGAKVRDDIFGRGLGDAEDYSLSKTQYSYTTKAMLDEGIGYLPEDNDYPPYQGINFTIEGIFAEGDTGWIGLNVDSNYTGLEDGETIPPYGDIARTTIISIENGTSTWSSYLVKAGSTVLATLSKGQTAEVTVQEVVDAGAETLTIEAGPAPALEQLRLVANFNSATSGSIGLRDPNFIVQFSAYKDTDGLDQDAVQMPTWATLQISNSFYNGDDSIWYPAAVSVNGVSFGTIPASSSQEYLVSTLLAAGSNLITVTAIT